MHGQGESDRRKSARLDMEQQLVQISWINGNGATITRDVKCVDVSQGGVQVELDCAIDIGKLVVIVFHPHKSHFKSYETEVLRCTQQQHGWFNLGLKFIDMQ